MIFPIKLRFEWRNVRIFKVCYECLGNFSKDSGLPSWHTVNFEAESLLNNWILSCRIGLTTILERKILYSKSTTNFLLMSQCKYIAINFIYIGFWVLCRIFSLSVYPHSTRGLCIHLRSILSCKSFTFDDFRELLTLGIIWYGQSKIASPANVIGTIFLV